MYTLKKLKRYYSLLLNQSGSSSINAFRLIMKRVNLYLHIVNDPIVQEFIDGEEFLWMYFWTLTVM